LFVHILRQTPFEISRYFYAKLHSVVWPESVRWKFYRDPSLHVQCEGSWLIKILKSFDLALGALLISPAFFKVVPHLYTNCNFSVPFSIKVCSFSINLKPIWPYKS
jgi:hypothetical protein